MLHTNNGEDKSRNPAGTSRELSPWLQRRLSQRALPTARPARNISLLPIFRAGNPRPISSGGGHLMTSLNNRPGLNPRISPDISLSGKSYLMYRRYFSGPPVWRELDLLLSRQRRVKRPETTWMTEKTGGPVPSYISRSLHDASDQAGSSFPNTNRFPSGLPADLAEDAAEDTRTPFPGFMKSAVPSDTRLSTASGSGQRLSQARPANRQPSAGTGAAPPGAVSRKVHAEVTEVPLPSGAAVRPASESGPSGTIRGKPLSPVKPEQKGPDLPRLTLSRGSESRHQAIPGRKSPGHDIQRSPDKISENFPAPAFEKKTAGIEARETTGGNVISGTPPTSDTLTAEEIQKFEIRATGENRERPARTTTPVSRAGSRPLPAAPAQAAAPEIIRRKTSQKSDLRLTKENILTEKADTSGKSVNPAGSDRKSLEYANRPSPKRLTESLPAPPIERKRASQEARELKAGIDVKASPDITPVSGQLKSEGRQLESGITGETRESPLQSPESVSSTVDNPPRAAAPSKAPEPVRRKPARKSDPRIIKEEIRTVQADTIARSPSPAVSENNPVKMQSKAAGTRPDFVHPVSPASGPLTPERAENTYPAPASKSVTRPGILKDNPLSASSTRESGNNAAAGTPGIIQRNIQKPAAEKENTPGKLPVIEPPAVSLRSEPEVARLTPDSVPDEVSREKAQPFPSVKSLAQNSHRENMGNNISRKPSPPMGTNYRPLSLAQPQAAKQTGPLPRNIKSGETGPAPENPGFTDITSSTGPSRQQTRSKGTVDKPDPGQHPLLISSPAEIPATLIKPVSLTGKELFRPVELIERKETPSPAPYFSPAFPLPGRSVQTAQSTNWNAPESDSDNNRASGQMRPKPKTTPRAESEGASPSGRTLISRTEAETAGSGQKQPGRPAENPGFTDIASSTGLSRQQTKSKGAVDKPDPGQHPLLISSPAEIPAPLIKPVSLTGKELFRPLELIERKETPSPAPYPGPVSPAGDRSAQTAQSMNGYTPDSVSDNRASGQIRPKPKTTPRTESEGASPSGRTLISRTEAETADSGQERSGATPVTTANYEQPDTLSRTAAPTIRPSILVNKFPGQIDLTVQRKPLLSSPQSSGSQMSGGRQPETSGSSPSVQKKAGPLPGRGTAARTNIGPALTETKSRENNDYYSLPAKDLPAVRYRAGLRSTVENRAPENSGIMPRLMRSQDKVSPISQMVVFPALNLPVAAPPAPKIDSGAAQNEGLFRQVSGIPSRTVHSSSSPAVYRSETMGENGLPGGSPSDFPESPSQDNGEKKIDYKAIAREVYPLIKRMIAVERERLPF